MHLNAGGQALYGNCLIMYNVYNYIHAQAITNIASNLNLINHDTSRRYCIAPYISVVYCKCVLNYTILLLVCEQCTKICMKLLQLRI